MQIHRGRQKNLMKRAIDFTLALVLIALLGIPIILIGILIKCTSMGSILYWSDRVGRNNCIFRMPKFRTMCIGTPELATHLLRDPEGYMTPVGRFLRSHSLDELPQLFSVLCGQMSFVGPRPALFNQDDLIALRTAAGIHRLIPGLTGWAQINGRDELSIPEKVRLEREYLQRRSLRWDIDILGRTVLTVIRKEGISH